MKPFCFLQFLEISKCPLSFAPIVCRMRVFSMEQNVFQLRMPVPRPTPFRTTGHLDLSVWRAWGGASEVLNACLAWLESTGVGAMRAVAFVDFVIYSYPYQLPAAG
jgi:hypothetical protein